MRARLDAATRERPRSRSLMTDRPAAIRTQLTALTAWRDRALTELARVVEPAHTQPLVAMVSTTAAPAAAGDADVALTTDDRRAVRGVLRTLMRTVIGATLDIARVHARANRWSQVRRQARVARDLRTWAAELGIGLRVSSRAVGLELLARYMLEGNSPPLRAELHDIAMSPEATPGLRTMAAEMHIVARNYEAAAEVLERGPALKTSRGATLIGVARPNYESPWIPFPENHYTYRFEVLSAAELDELQRQLDEIDEKNQEDPSPMPPLRELGVDTAKRVVRCHRSWAAANAAFAEGHYVAAVREYLHTQSEIDDYFLQLRGTVDPAKLFHHNQRWQHNGREVRSSPELVSHFGERYKTITLRELHHLDWQRPRRTPAGFDPYESVDSLIHTLGTWPGKIAEKLDTPLATIRFVFLPLAIAEASLARRRFDDNDDRPGAATIAGALSSVKRGLRFHELHRIMSEHIERPFAAILKSRILIAKGDAQYKARLRASRPLLRDDGTERYQGLAAAASYQGVLDALTRTGLAEYVTNVATAAATQRAEIEGLRPLALDPSVRQLAAETRPPGDSDRDPRPPSPTTDQARAWRELGIDPRLPDLRSAHGALMGLATRRSPHEPLIRFDDKPSPARNPILIALAAEATARLLQLDAGLNYLGYADDYVPPWRFAYLVDRARYFTSHARQVQAMYLAFLQSAEREHLQEQSAAHNAALEQASVAVETQRLEQSRAELATSQAGTQLATLVAVNAAARATDYVALDQRLDEIARKQKKRRRWGNALRVVGSALVSAGEGFAKSGGNPYAAAASAGMSVFNDIPDILEASNANLQLDAQDEQREFEKRNYARAAAEATGSVVVAARREQAAAAAVEVASLTRLVALMRHEAALQMLAFLRNRTLNAELWYRLADAVRSVAATYLERAVELAFLAERALEYETGRRHDVVRFDYDASELGDFLAADLLARDVDALEHALIVGETARRQVVRYVVSLARDYPDTLERLRNRGAATLHVTLAQLEARFSGMVNLRIAAVDIQPIALLDPTRFAIQLTHLGTSQARMRNAADSPALGAEPVPSWTADTETDGTPPALTIDGRWPVMGFAAAPATEVFTGISPLLQAQLDPDVAARQRKAFESRGAASSWRIDLSARENRLEPITLADVLVAFELTGTHDPVLEPELRARIPTDSVQTTHLVASSTFPSAHFDFARRGTMTWEVDQGWIPTGLRTGLLRNVGFVLHSRSMPGHLGRITATTEVRVHVAADGTVTLGTPIPRVTLSIERLQVTARVELDGPVDSLRWQFDTDTDWLDAEAGTDVVHTFVRPGRYDARLRLVRAGRLVELTVALAVSADEDLAPPLLVVPTVDVVDTGDVDETRVAIGVTNGPEEPDAFTARWIGTDDDGPIARTEPAEIVLARGRTHTIEVEAVRTLRARVSCTQRYSDTANLTVTDLIATTNRASDEPPTELTQLLFGPGDDLSPLDTWVLELPADVNPALRVADATGRIDVDTSDIEDLRLVLEYATTSRD